MNAAKEALDRLQDGNRRFVSGSQAEGTYRRERVSEASPIAVILGCADSRVPVEVVFDQGIGDLFVVRVAGNIATPSQIGSIEFAVEQFATPLVVVLGHSMCGAVAAAIEDLGGSGEDLSPNLGLIVDEIRPSVEQSVATEGPDDPDALLERAVRANIRASSERLLQESAVLGKRVTSGALLIVGAQYSLDTGVVEFLDASALKTGAAD